MNARSRGNATTVGLLGLLTLAILTGVACDKQASCRPGTVFVHVDIGPFTMTNAADVGVSIDGATAMTTSLPIAPGVRAGGVEVVFPRGYPSGKAVTILVTLKANGTPIAAHDENIGALGGGCDAIDVTFTGADGITGAGGAGGSNGGGGGSGGAAGTAAAGRGGAGGGIAGTTGGSVAGTSGGGRGGAGGATGGSVAGSSGVAGRGGMGGAGGTTGVGGRGGAGGTGGTGGTSACVPTGAENCFNGKDDDCDMRVDCADTDCSPMVAQCIALDPTGGKIGLMVAATAACPTGYTDVTAIMKGLTPGPCGGCSCAPPPVVCSATVASFATAALCNTASNAGVPAATISTAQACTKPTWDPSAFTAYGVSAGAFTASATGSCTAMGSPVPPAAPSWGVMSRFCATTTIGAGCAAGQVCVPANAAARCLLADGARSCAAGQTADAWYTSYQGAQTCGACGCTQTAAGNCNSMTISVGSDYTCAPAVATLTATNLRACFPSGVYEPGVLFVGTPTRPTCQGSSAGVVGTLAQTGPKTVCCVP